MPTNDAVVRPRRRVRAARWGARLGVLGVIGVAGGCGVDGGDAAKPDGSIVYAARCAACHGADLRGTAVGPSPLSVVYEPSHHSDDSFRSAIRNGSPAHHWNFGDMPPVPGMSDAEIEAVIAFIRGVQQREGFEPYPPG